MYTVCGDPHKAWSRFIEIDDGAKYCRGSIISDRHVLTAKDCIASGKKIKLLKEAHSHDPQEIAIKKIIQLKSNASNVAVLELVTPLDFDQHTGPICLPEDSSGPLLIYCENCYEPTFELKCYEWIGETDAYDEMTSRKGFVVNRKTHITAKNYKDSHQGCPDAPSTLLYSEKNSLSATPSSFAVGVLYTKDMKKICEETETILADNLFQEVYKRFFKHIFKNAKICPPAKETHFKH